jgi:mannose-6-phosphate isomerase-like protein (cupin superfamily)
MISKRTAEHYRWGGTCDGWRLVHQPELSVIHERMPPGTRETPHHHARARQFFFVLTGALTLDVDGAVEVIHAGEGLEIAPGARHQARNDAGDDVEFLVVSQPTSMGDRVT